VLQTYRHTDHAACPVDVLAMMPFARDDDRSDPDPDDDDESSEGGSTDEGDGSEGEGDGRASPRTLLASGKRSLVSQNSDLNILDGALGGSLDDGGGGLSSSLPAGGPQSSFYADGNGGEGLLPRKGAKKGSFVTVVGGEAVALRNFAEVRTRTMLTPMYSRGVNRLSKCTVKMAFGRSCVVAYLYEGTPYLCLF
jgi:hypothetical protein